MMQQPNMMATNPIGMQQQLQQPPYNPNQPYQNQQPPMMGQQPGNMMGAGMAPMPATGGVIPIA